MLPPAAFTPTGLRPGYLECGHPATQLSLLMLGLVAVLVASPLVLLLALALLEVALLVTGISWGQQWAAQRPWWSMAVLVVITHTLTTLSAAPLGRPSLAGLVGGLLALGRVLASVSLLVVYRRVVSLDNVVVGLGWWLRPLASLGLPVRDLGLVLAVAMGTVPLVAAEGRRLEMVGRMRRAGATVGGRGHRVQRWFARIVDRAQAVVPLLETLARRAEALNLSLRHRRPNLTAGKRRLPLREGVLLAVAWGVLVWRLW